MSELTETTNLSSQEESVLVALIQEQFKQNQPVSKSCIDTNLKKFALHNPIETGIALLRLAKKNLIISKMVKVPGWDQAEERHELSTTGKEWVLANETLLETKEENVPF
ncbi:MAG: hypothetical protein KIT56_00915 [Gammaproteobacteria bacterium]|nr:hypothetical protein [Gammaproteobacteria bacterium]MCW5582446.1 hypothetical protein [Gammaproteobacteria bacterium]